MNTFSEDFAQLEQNVQQLIQQKKTSDLQLDSLKNQLEEMRNSNLAQEREIEALKEKNKILHIAEGTKDGDTREIKLKINEMVREVDKCIAQLNQ